VALLMPKGLVGNLLDLNDRRRSRVAAAPTKPSGGAA
jgi:hypothetical protein